MIYASIQIKDINTISVDDPDIPKIKTATDIQNKHVKINIEITLNKMLLFAELSLRRITNLLSILF